MSYKRFGDSVTTPNTTPRRTVLATHTAGIQAVGYRATVRVRLFEYTPAPRGTKVHYCMLAHPFQPARVAQWPVAVEPKLDGVRVLAHVDVTRGTVQFRSRNNNAFTSLDHLAPELLCAVAAAGWRRAVLDGEVVGESFHEIMGQVRQHHGPAHDAVYWVFDALTAPEYAKGKTAAYCTRRERVQKICAGLARIKAVPAQLCGTLAEVEAACHAAWAAGHEGVIVKDTQAGYERRRSHAFMKIKRRATEDLTVIEVIEGTGQDAGRLGALRCRRGDQTVRISAGHCTDAQREEIWRQRRRLPGRIAEVAFQEVTAAGALREGRFVRWRDILVHGVKA